MSRLAKFIIEREKLTESLNEMRDGLSFLVTSSTTIQLLFESTDVEMG